MDLAIPSLVASVERGDRPEFPIPPLALRASFHFKSLCYLICAVETIGMCLSKVSVGVK